MKLPLFLWDWTIETGIAFLFVESAWEGSSKFWGSVKAPEGLKQLEKVTTLCKNKNIPTVFWHKEGPFHFKSFLQAARLFDFIATTDINCIERYKKLCGTSDVFVLPFAAQPKLHKPTSGKRLFRPCFAGTFRGKQYPQRAKAMRYILKPAIKYGLHIFDRKYNKKTGGSFPEPYKKAVKGGKNYLDIIKQYKKYKLFMNVDSVVDSPTHCSRRVFELLACGTPVISSLSLAIQKMFPSVMISKNAKQTDKHIKNLLKDEVYWTKLSSEGLVEILSKHTYAHRLNTIRKNIKV